MKPRPPLGYTNLYLSLGFLAFALIAAFLWIPLDTGSGLVLKVRRQVVIGDALAPTIAAGMIGLGALLVFFQRREPYPNGLTLSNMRYLAGLLAVFAIGFALMRWAGPFVVGIASLLSDDDMVYRTLRDTAPWKYLGFLFGSSFIVGGLIAAIEGRLSWRAALVAVGAAVVLILLYDVPFDDLVLPPNGDV